MAGNVLVGIVMGSDSDEVEEKNKKLPARAGFCQRREKEGKSE